MKSVILGIFAVLTLSNLSLAGASGKKIEAFRHVVCFKFKDGTSATEISEIEKAFAALKGKIETITDFEWGPTDNIEPLNDGFTHCFIVSFKNKAGLEVYLPHPEHTNFVELLKPKLDKVFVFDFSAR